MHAPPLAPQPEQFAQADSHLVSKAGYSRPLEVRECWSMPRITSIMAMTKSTSTISAFAWMVERERHRSILTAEDAVTHAEIFVPISSWIARNYVSNTELKKRYFDLESIERTDEKDGRERIGTTFHCRHELADVKYLNVDFDPPKYVTFEGFAFDFTALSTLRIVPVVGGSNFEIYRGRSYEVFGPDDITLQQKLANTAPKIVFSRPDVAAGRFASILFKDHR
jgi:hypothetical protein